MFRAVRWPVRATLFVGLIGAAAVLSACGDPSVDEPTGSGRAVGAVGAAGLEGTTWELDRSASSPQIPEGGTITLQADGKQVSGVAACNRYFGDYTIDGDSLELGALGSTNMACLEGMEAERAYLAALEKVRTVEESTPDRLVLSGEGISLVFLRQADEAIDLTWSIVNVNTGDALESAVNGTDPTITFDPDSDEGASGAVRVETGCNILTTTYQRDGRAISFGPIEATEMACAEPAGVDRQERALKAALESAVEVQVDDTLTLLDDAGRMVIVGTAKAG